MTKRLTFAVVMIASLILAPFSAAPSMADMASTTMTHEMTHEMMHEMTHEIAATGAPMADCPSMAANSSDAGACSENIAQGCCKDHASCSTNALAPVGDISNFILNSVRLITPPLADNLMSIALNHSTPPPKS